MINKLIALIVVVGILMNGGYGQTKPTGTEPTGDWWKADMTMRYELLKVKVEQNKEEIESLKEKVLENTVGIWIIYLASLLFTILIMDGHQDEWHY